MGQVVGILLAWIFGSCLTIALFQWLVHPARTYKLGAEDEALDDQPELEGSPETDHESQRTSASLKTKDVEEGKAAKCDVVENEK